MTITLYHNDNRQILPDLETNSIDAVITDPPYNILSTMPWDTWPPIETFRQITRVLKPDGFFVFTIAPHIAHLRAPDALQETRILEVGFWIWGSGRPVTKTRLKRSFDLVYFCSQHNRHLYTEQARLEHRTPETKKVSRRKALGRQFNHAKQKTPHVGGNHYHPANVASQADNLAPFKDLPHYEHIFAVKRSSRKVTGDRHPTEKPLDLIAQLVKLTTKEGDIVLDPFMGGGSTGEAATMLGRDFVGIEGELEYIDMARKRLQPYTEVIS